MTIQQATLLFFWAVIAAQSFLLGASQRTTQNALRSLRRALRDCSRLQQRVAVLEEALCIFGYEIRETEEYIKVIRPAVDPEEERLRR